MVASSGSTQYPYRVYGVTVQLAPVGGSFGAGDTTWPGPPRPQPTPRSCPRAGPFRLSLRRSSLFAVLRCAVRGELLQQRGEFSLDLDDLSRLVEIAGEPFDLGLQAGDLTITGIGLLAPCRSGQGLGALLSLASPVDDQRGVQALATEQCAPGRSVEAVVIGQDRGLVLRREAPAARRTLGDLGVRWGWVVHRTSMQARVVKVVDCRGHGRSSFSALSAH